MNYVHDIETVKRLLAFSYFQKGMAFIYAGEEFGNDRTPSLLILIRLTEIQDMI